jgi:hypothetical protein
MPLVWVEKEYIERFGGRIYLNETDLLKGQNMDWTTLKRIINKCDRSW